MKTSDLRHKNFALNRFYQKKFKPVLSFVLATLTFIGGIIVCYEIGTWYFCTLGNICGFCPTGLELGLMFTFLSAVAYTFTY